MELSPQSGQRGRVSVNELVRWAVLVVAGVVVIAGVLKVAQPVLKERAIKRNQYQAVFLSNGQVYFGKLSGITKDYVKLTDIYYLQVQQRVQPAETQNNNQQPQVSLAKLGNELHGPEDVMYVSRDQVLFWENLKDDGRVVKAIKDHKSK